jgi:hypothetical protein
MRVSVVLVSCSGKRCFDGLEFARDGVERSLACRALGRRGSCRFWRRFGNSASCHRVGCLMGGGKGVVVAQLFSYLFGIKTFDKNHVGVCGACSARFWNALEARGQAHNRLSHK